ncbi:LysR family transcriptional regulator [Siculibacillus lacustris]|uniref:LysR family transcriptional regulator n=1 Tax=Siculibacillus lacustris TaxID=1549641 RepID=A0A4Q9VKY1_9HYPH|nr:LysR family transcriptional regulator [Siculibacillus lacustris]TBW36105.1 LysR family transcriptional regulator [Siculibacillus lacustris]
MQRNSDRTGTFERDDLDWDEIRTFAEVVDTGSFSEAAQVLGVNQATVSRRIARLEDCARTALFERSGGGAALAAEAQELAEIAARIRRQAHEFADALKSLRTANGAVRIKATERVYNYMLTPLVTGVHMGPLQEVMARRPDLLMPGIRLVSAEAGGEAEIALVWSAPGATPEADPDDKVRRLARLRYGVFYTDPYFADGRRPVPRVLDDLARDHMLVSLPRLAGTEDWNAWGRWFAVVEKAGERATVVEWSSVSERLVLSGAALALLPVYTPCLNPSLRELPLEDAPIYLDLWKVTRRAAARRADVREIAEKLIAIFAEVDWTTTRTGPP